MRNITISLDDDTANWARRLAAERQISVSRWVSELIAEKHRSSDAYQAAMRAYFARKPSHPLSNPGERYPTREELYDRPVLRRR
ncbi:MAG: CopG family transcriptional regulator [Steroidobacteraceae bacterium]